MQKNPDPEAFKAPDPRLHLYVSLGKSAIRILAGVAFFYNMVWIGGVLLILAEFVGIVEELV